MHLADFTYSWVNASLDTGLRQHVTDKNGSRTTYTYDVLNRLTLATAPQESYAYSYDANSNRTSQTVNGATTTYAHNAADQLTTAGTVTYSYDANGNETSSSAGRQWSYNPKDQAMSATPPGGSPIPMSYTGTGQFKRVSAGSTTFMTSGLGLSRENSTHYTRDDNRQLISQRTPSGNYYYLLDGLGSVAALTDNAGNTAATYSYEPFGKLKSSTGIVPNPYRWLGGLGVYYDTSTGLYKMGTRYYDPGLGRFTQVDPIAGGSANAYDYVAQDPINHVDLDGQLKIPSFGVCFLAISYCTTSKKKATILKQIVGKIEDVLKAGNQASKRLPPPIRRCLGGAILLGVPGLLISGGTGGVLLVVGCGLGLGRGL